MLMHIMQQFDIVPKSLASLLEDFNGPVDVSARSNSPVVGMPKSSSLVGWILRQVRRAASSQLDTHISVATFLFKELYPVHHLFKRIARRMAIAIDRKTPFTSLHLVDLHSRHFSFHVP